MMKHLVFFLLLTGLVLAGCDAMGKNKAESALLSIAEDCREYTAKLPNLADAATANAELEQLAKRIEFNTGQLAGLVSQQGQEKVRSQIGMETRQRFNGDLTALIEAIGEAEKRLGRTAIAPSVNEVKGAVGRLSNTL